MLSDSKIVKMALSGGRAQPLPTFSSCQGTGSEAQAQGDRAITTRRPFGEAPKSAQPRSIIWTQEEEQTSEKSLDVEAVELDKSNVLLLGPTGAAKTLMAKTLAKLVDAPLAIVDATSLTQAGYVGDDVESILYKLYREAGSDVARAERGICIY